METGEAELQMEHEKLAATMGEFEKQLSQTNTRLATMENELKSRTEERDAAKRRVAELELQMSEVHKTQSKSEEVLTKAKAMIFEKTKVCKNQELQIEALKQQVESLKEVVRITKDLLEIRNVEIKHLEDKLNSMETKIDSESGKNKSIQEKLEKMVSMNAELKREYETQLCLFSALRERYNERELARNVLDELRNNQSKETAAANGEKKTDEEQK